MKRASGLPALLALAPIPLLAAGNALAAAADPLATPSRAAFSIMDFLLMALLGYLAWRLISRIANRDKDKDDEPPTYDVTPRDNEEDISPQERRSRAAQAAWEYLTGEKGADLHGEDKPKAVSDGGFDERDFLRGAKLMYGRVRQSWAGRDMADLRQFTAPDMMREFERMNSENPAHEKVAVLLVDAKVLEVNKEEKRTVVRVAYEATLSDDPANTASRKVSETWVFSRDDTVVDGHWLLESMEAAA